MNYKYRIKVVTSHNGVVYYVPQRKEKIKNITDFINSIAGNYYWCYIGNIEQFSCIDEARKVIERSKESDRINYGQCEKTHKYIKIK